MTTYFTWIWIVFVYEVFQLVSRKLQRRSLYEKAKTRARKTGKRLLVIGDPNNGISNSIFGTDYEGGDECLDITGCPQVKGNSKKYKGRVEDILPRMDLSNRVVFISCVLEFVDDMELIAKTLSKLDPEDLYVVTVSPWTIEAWFYPRALTGEPPIKRVVFYDGTSNITWLNLPKFLSFVNK